MSIDKTLDGFIQPISDTAAGIIFYSISLPFGAGDLKLILVWLALAAIFLTLYMRFVNFRLFGHAFSLLKRDLADREEDPKDGQISRFKALSTSLSGTVGLGNIAGVAVAVSVGGPGAVFWMIVMGFLSMATKFVEVAAAVKYRVQFDNGDSKRVSGGPMYYLRQGFADRGMAVPGKILASVFAVCCIGGSLGGGNMFQSNQAYQQFLAITGGEASYFADKGWLFGLGLAFLVGLVILGGIKSIAGVASKLVPSMAVLYMITSFIVIGMHYTLIPEGLSLIFTSAFSSEAGIGGLLGALLVGIQRAVFSNEAGLGSSSIVHATARTDSHISQGAVGMLGPFFDTVVICLTTALLIVITGVYKDTGGVEGIALTSAAMAQGSVFFPYILALCVSLFAFSTLITWFYYGMKGFGFLFGSNKIVETFFKLFFCACIILGASAELSSIISLTDAMLLSMAIPNLIGVYLLAPEIKRDLKKYIANLKK